MCKYTNLLIQILHLAVSSLQDAQVVLAAASAAGFRESGAIGLCLNQMGDFTPVVAVRSTGLAFDTIIGYENEEKGITNIVTKAHLKLMAELANERFRVNSERRSRFRSALLSSYTGATKLIDNEIGGKSPWEDKATRQARKRQEGLARQQALNSTKQESRDLNVELKQLDEQ
jgi:tRNA wybutosine-synthesizing protein 3